LAVIVFGIVNLLNLFPDEPEGKIELAPVRVSNPSLETKESPMEFGEVTSGSTPTVLLNVLNRTRQAQVVSSARIEVVDEAHLSSCLFQGGGGGNLAFGSAVLRLPYRGVGAERRIEVFFKNDPGDDTELARSVEIPAAGAAPVYLRFVSPAPRPGTSLYRLRVELEVTGHEGMLDAKEVVLAFPGPPPRGGDLLPEDRDLFDENHEVANAKYDSDATASPTWCLERNRREVDRLVAPDAKMAPIVEELRNVQPFAGFRALVAARPASEAAERLVASSTADRIALGGWIASTELPEPRRSKLRNAASNALVALVDRDQSANATTILRDARSLATDGPTENEINARIRLAQEAQAARGSRAAQP
jgi:hypothetical protein